MFRLSKLKKEVKFNREIGNMINVLKGVASSEYYRLNNHRKKLDEFGEQLKMFFQMVDVAGVKHLMLEKSNLPQAIVIITSDAGLLGKLNVAIVSAALAQYSGKEQCIVVGRQGSRYVEEEIRKKFDVLQGISDDVKYEEAEKLGDLIIQKFLNREVGRTIVVYPHFLSFTSWQPQTYQLLPCKFLFPDASSMDKYSGRSSEERVIIEPSVSKVIECLVREMINYILFGIFWESKLSEWAARVMHLDGSFNRLDEERKELKLKYFRTLHELSDKSIREICSGRLEVQKHRQLL